MSHSVKNYTSDYGQLDRVDYLGINIAKILIYILVTQLSNIKPVLAGHIFDVQKNILVFTKLCSFNFPTIIIILLSKPRVNRLPRSVWSMWLSVMTYPAVVMMLRLLGGYYKSVGVLMLWLSHHTCRFCRSQKEKSGMFLCSWHPQCPFIQQFSLNLPL